MTDAWWDGWEARWWDGAFRLSAHPRADDPEFASGYRAAQEDIDDDNADW